jgi:hypothetical protein
MTLRAVTLLTCLLTVGTIGLRAVEQNPLPAFTVVSSGDVAVPSSQLSKEARWLLIYVSPSCGSCERLLSALVDWQRTLPPSRLVVVIQAAPDVARTYAQQHGIDQAAGMAWYADTDQSGSRALGLQHIPALVAVDHGRTKWVLTGVLNDPRAVETVVRSWTGY